MRMGLRRPGVGMIRGTLSREQRRLRKCKEEDKLIQAE